MEILTAVALGVVAGLLMKTLFMKNSSIVWDAAFGALGGLSAYYIAQGLSDKVAGHIATVGVAVLVAGILHTVWTRINKTA